MNISEQRLLDQGKRLMSINENVEALSIFDKILAKNPNNYVAAINKGQTLLKLKKIKDAITVFNHILKSRPNAISAIHGLGIANIRLKNYENALKIFQQYEKIKSDAHTWRHIADLKLILNKPEEALNAYDKSLQLDPNYLNSLTNKGGALNSMGRYQEAIDVFDRALQIKPDAANIMYNKSLAYFALENYYEAYYAIEEALSIKPNKKEFLEVKSDIEYELGSYTQALVTLDRILKLDPTSAVTLNNKGLVLSKLNSDTDALICLDESLKNDPSYLLALRSKMRILEKAGKFDEALDVVNTILKIEENPHMLYHKGVDLIELNRFGEALEVLERSLQLNKDDLSTLVQIIRILKKLNRENEAEKKIKELVNKIDYEKPVTNVGVLLIDLGYFELALHLFNKMLSTDPRDPNSWYNKACVLSKMKKIDEAIDALLISCVLDTQYKTLQKNDQDFENIRDAPRYISYFN